MVKSDLSDFKFPTAVIVTSIVVATLLGLFVGRPLWNGMQQKRAELKQKKVTLTALEVKLENLKQLASREEELKQKNAKVLAALPSDKDVSRLFVQLERVASENGLTVKRVNETVTGTTGGTINKLNYEVNAEGSSYLNFRSAVEKLNTALRLLSIDGIDINRTSEKSGITLKLKVLTFARGEE